MKFIDLITPHKENEYKLNNAIKGVFFRSDFILGQDVKLFEDEFANYCGTRYAVGVNSGTDALFLALKSLDVHNGDEVIVPVFTFIATALAVSYTGAKPVFVDIDENTYCIDAGQIEKSVTKRTKAIIPVHLYGHPADMRKILNIAKRHDLKIVEDAAQAHGANYSLNSLRKKTGSMSDAGCFSFYPTKNLGGCGDAGAIVTNNKKVQKQLLMLRDSGRISRYSHAITGYNSRLDTLQAAILRVKLKKLDSWNGIRRKKAKLYNQLLSDVGDIILPYEEKNVEHAYHLYVIRSKQREKICNRLKKHNIPFLIHYPIPLHLQKAYKTLGYKKGDFPIAERIANEVISLPLHPFLGNSQIKQVVKAIKGD